MDAQNELRLAQADRTMKQTEREEAALKLIDTQHGMRKLYNEDQEFIKNYSQGNTTPGQWQEHEYKMQEKWGDYARELADTGYIPADKIPTDYNRKFVRDQLAVGDKYISMFAKNKGNESAPEYVFKQGADGEWMRFDKKTGDYVQITKGKPKEDKGFTLSPGQKRFDSQGEEVASVPKLTGSDEKPPAQVKLMRSVKDAFKLKSEKAAYEKLYHLQNQSKTPEEFMASVYTAAINMGRSTEAAQKIAEEAGRWFGGASGASTKPVMRYDKQKGFISLED